MAKYRLTEDGVFDTETFAAIPAASGNRHWQEYQEWLAAGNTPDPDPTDYLAAAKADRIAQIWAEANRRVDAVGAGYAADSSDVTYPAKAKRRQDQHVKRLTKLAKGQSLSAGDDALHDAYDAFLDWADLTFDAAQLGEDAVEAAADEAAVAAVAVSWPAVA